jgi:hypothetical protein
MIAESVKIRDHKIAKHTRLVSFEPSHSFLKRCDDEGVIILQGGYRVNPKGRIQKDDENVLIQFEGQSRYYGTIASLGTHESPLTQRKETSARMGFAATLRPSDDCTELTVVLSHWDEDRAKAIAASLKGSYSVIRNGHPIRCVVKEVFAQLEDEGTYQLLKPSLKPGRTLLIGSGQGTSQEWIINANGFFTGQATENLAVSRLVQMIADDQVIRGASLKLGESSVNLDGITQGLKTGTYGDMPREHWECIVDRYVGQWYEGFKNYLLKTYGTELQSISNIVFSGGGAELIRKRAGKFAIIPTDAQTASVRGAYQHHAARLGVR